MMDDKNEKMNLDRQVERKNYEETKMKNDNL